ncbi:MAG: hypothetical protein KGP12_08795 [Actinomycetales bacterium]|nr:hypothetical protein [Actinomycetales bacterium]
MPSWGAFSYLFGPLLAFLGIGVLILVLRWAFGRRTSVVAAAPRAGSADQYGLLVAVASPATYVEGEILRRRLQEAGLRANLAQTLDGPRVMVWPADEEQARWLLR